MRIFTRLDRGRSVRFWEIIAVVLIVFIISQISISQNSISQNSLNVLDDVRKNQGFALHGSDVQEINPDQNNLIIPFSSGEFGEDAFPKSCVIQDSIAYVACGEQGLRLVNVADPHNPEEISSYKNGNSIDEVFISGNYAFTRDFWGRIEIIDISNANNPTKIVQLLDDPSPGELGADHVTDIHVEGNYAYISRYNGLLIYNLTDINNPTYVNELASSYYEAIHIQNNYAYVVERMSGLIVINITDPLNLNILSSTPAGNDGKTIYVSGEIAYISDSQSGFYMMNITDPLNPTILYQDSSLNLAMGFSVEGNYLYMAVQEQSMYIFDITDSSNPNLIIQYKPADETPIAVTVHDSIAYLCMSGSEGLQIIDVSNPATPVKIGEMNQGSGGGSPYTMQYIMYGLEAVLVISVIFVAVYANKKSSINIFLSHARSDAQSYRIPLLKKGLQKEANIKNIFVKKAGENQSDQKWNQVSLDKSTVFVYLITRDSLESDDCLNMLNYAKDNEIFIVPLKAKDLSWTDLDNLKLSRELGFELDLGNMENSLADLYRYIDKFREDLDSLKKKLKKAKIVSLKSLKKELDLSENHLIKLIKIILRNSKVKGSLSLDKTLFFGKKEVIAQISRAKKSNKNSSFKELIIKADLNPEFASFIQKITGIKSKNVQDIPANRFENDLLGTSQNSDMQFGTMENKDNSNNVVQINVVPVDMNFCPLCGVKIEQHNMKFCKFCGEKFEVEIL